jgi:hypothetical protein
LTLVWSCAICVPGGSQKERSRPTYRWRRPERSFPAELVLVAPEAGKLEQPRNGNLETPILSSLDRGTLEWLLSGELRSELKASLESIQKVAERREWVAWSDVVPSTVVRIKDPLELLKRLKA